MSGQIVAWHAEHLNFARLLKLLEGEVARFAAGEAPDYDLMRDLVYYLLHFPDVHHHRYENEVFTRVAARDHSLKPLVTRLLQEHRVIASCGERLLALIEAVIGGAVATRAELEAAAATYLVYYRGHLAAEESKMLPRVAQMMGEADWAAVAAAVETQSRDDPLFGPAAEERFRGLRLAIEREVAAQGR